MKKRILSVLVENRAGVLSRIAGLFSRRGYNIDSLSVGTVDDPAFSRMTIGVTANDWQTEQIMKQLNKQIPVIKVAELLPEDSLIREILIIKVSATVEHRREIKDLADIYKASVLDVTQNTMILEVTGSEKKIESFIEHIRTYGLLEMARSSSVGMQRGTASF
ncbi:MAG: acetolactate synthase small subunit [Peptostreptococcaceae bacterium]|nr:acetolactate synthase small subunit [Peptostreptococcaceae bacterium]